MDVFTLFSNFLKFFFFYCYFFKNYKNKLEFQTKLERMKFKRDKNFIHFWANCKTFIILIYLAFDLLSSLKIVISVRNTKSSIITNKLNIKPQTTFL